MRARPLEAPLKGFSIAIPVRFAECDSYGVVWHGHYALYLEQESHFEESEDSLLTMLNVGGERLKAADSISAWMRLGRVRRQQADFDGATIAYAEAGRLAKSSGDQHSVLLSRVGLCNVLHFRGNLPEAERGWRELLADASVGEYRIVEAHAHHGLGNLLQRRGQAHQGEQQQQEGAQ